MVLKGALSMAEVDEINAALDALPKMRLGEWFGHAHMTSGPGDISLQQLYELGEPFERRDAEILKRYDAEIAGTYCPPHCGVCLDSCPEAVPIPDVLRHRMYFEDYGWEKIAIEQYSRLETNASACSGCSAPCLASCPLGIHISERTEGAHRLLTLS